jgi:hypothetical protein
MKLTDPDLKRVITEVGKLMVAPVLHCTKSFCQSSKARIIENPRGFFAHQFPKRLICIASDNSVFKFCPKLKMLKNLQSQPADVLTQIGQFHGIIERVHSRRWVHSPFEKGENGLGVLTRFTGIVINKTPYQWPITIK